MAQPLPSLLMQLFYCTQNEILLNKDVLYRPDDHRINAGIWAKLHMCFLFSWASEHLLPKKQEKRCLLPPIYLLVRIFSEVAIGVNKQQICVALAESPCRVRVKPDG